MRIAVILPSRGLIFSRTAEEIVRNLRGVKHKIYFSHKKPIPECFEEPTQEALKDPEVTHLFFVEDDMIIPDNTLWDMYSKDVAVVTCDYPVSKEGRGSVLRDKGGKVLVCGTGCLLVKREVFDELKPPYFHTNYRWTFENMGDFIRLTAEKNPKKDGYGLHDVNFSLSLHRLSQPIPIHVMDVKCGQRKLIALGKSGSNDGAHKIEQWSKVKKDYMLKKIMSEPVRERGNLTTVITETGEVTLTKEHAKKLIGLGLATKPPKVFSVIDDSEMYR